MNALIERHWEQVEGWLDALFDVPADERHAWLAARCTDAALRDAVIALARAEDDGARALEGVREGVAGAPRAGMRIGPYRLLQPLGEGGMALVFLAERVTAEFTQRVALKLMRVGILGAAQLDAFRREQRIHAALEHPHIARVYDSGITATGLPYFAVEHVDGAPIDRYCDTRKLDVEARLRLFLDVCDAVQFAHQSLVVHRDLKPSNILVTNGGSAKLLDFGIAKLIDADARDATRTATQQRHLTPAYAAPEQFTGGPITTATDVYALGVLLAELLTGRRPPPADLGETTGRRAVSRYVREADATSIADRAACRGTDPATLTRRLRGDLDSIVAHALAPEPGRRYPSASALGDDVRRHLGGLPVLARPDSFAYRTGKFVSRHKRGIAVAVLVGVALIGATVISASQASRARREAARAALEAERANAVRGFLLQLFVEIAPGKSAPPQSAQEVLERGRAEAERRFSGRPELMFDVLGAIGRVELQRGRLAEAREPLQRAVLLAEMHFGPGDERTLTAVTDLAELDEAQGRFEDGDKRLSAAIANYRATPRVRETNALAFAMVKIGSFRSRLGDAGAAIAHTAEALALARRLDAKPDVLRTMLQGHGGALFSAGRVTEALPLQVESLRLTIAEYGPEHVSTAKARDALAAVHRSLGDIGAAETESREAVRIMRTVYAEPSQDLAMSVNDLAVIVALGGKIGEAATLFEEALALQRKVYGAEHPYIATTLGSVGGLQSRLGRYAEAEQTQRAALALMRRLRGADHPLVTRNEVELGRTLLRLGRLDESATLLDAALAADLGRFPEASQQVAADRLALADLDLARGRADQAHENARLATASYGQLVKPTHPKALEARLVLARTLHALGRAAEADTELVAVGDSARAAVPRAAYLEARAAIERARNARGAGDRAAARALLDAARRTLHESGADEPRLHVEIEAEQKLLE